MTTEIGKVRRARLRAAVERSLELERARRYREAEEALAGFGTHDLVERERMRGLRERLRTESVGRGP